MINQQSISLIQSSSLSFPKQELIYEILKIKYQDQQINNRAFRSISPYLEINSKSIYQSIQPTSQQIKARDFLSFNQTQQKLQSCYSMVEIMGVIENVIERRIEKDYNQPLSVAFYCNKKYWQIANSRTFKTQSLKDKKKSMGSSSTSRNSDSRSKNTKKILSQVETNEQSSLMLQKIGHDLSRMIQQFHHHHRNSSSLFLNLNNKFLIKKTNQKQKQFKMMLDQINISKIQPNCIPDYYDGNQIKSVLQYYGLKNTRTKKSSKSKKKIPIKLKSKDKQSMFMVTKRSNHTQQIQRQRVQYSQISSPTQNRKQYNYLSPMTPTPRYACCKREGERQQSQNSKINRHKRQKTPNIKLKKSRDSTTKSKKLILKNIGSNKKNNKIK